MGPDPFLLSPVFRANSSQTSPDRDAPFHPEGSIPIGKVFKKSTREGEQKHLDWLFSLLEEFRYNFSTIAS